MQDRLWLALHGHSSLNSGPFLASCVVRVPYYAGDLERDPNLENYPLRATGSSVSVMVNPRKLCETESWNMDLGGLVLGSLILYLKGMRIPMFQLSGYYWAQKP